MIQTINPTTGKKIASYASYPASKVDDIINKAHKAFEDWRTLPFKKRAIPMRKAAALLKKNKEQYAQLMAEEMGKPFQQGVGEIEKCAWVCEYYAKEAEHYLAHEKVKTDAKKSYVCFEPLGIVLAVMPWNFPFWQVFRCAAPTLMAGNAIILKHASNVSGCALVIEKVFKQAGFPAGLFRTVLIGSERVAGLIEHPYIQAVTLTGSTGAGQSIAAKAGSMIKKTVLELGGSDAYVVLKDADIDLAVKTCVAARMVNGGQSCVAAKRFIVEEDILQEFTEKFVLGMQAMRMGASLNEGVNLGPLARRDLRDQIHTQVLKSIAQGAKLLLGGQIPEGPGAFYPPTVLGNVRPGMVAYSEELFGPVASIIKARDEHDAIRIANDSVFGLGAAIFSKNVKKAERLAAHALQAGCCFVNSSVKSDPRLPFGGIKQSGYGREVSGFGIREFVNIKTVYIQ